MSSNYLFELGTEELPPTALLSLSESLSQSVQQSLAENDLSFDTFHGYCSPRRLAFLVEGLADKTPLNVVKVWGPPAKIAFDSEGQPSKAALAFCKRNQIQADELKVENDGKVDKVVCESTQGGESTAIKLPQLVEAALASLPIPRRMRWGASRTEFVRPVHWLVFLKGSERLEASMLGLSSGSVSQGHRFLSDGDIQIDNALDYAKVLKEKGKVLVDFDERKHQIRSQVEALASTLKAKAVISEDLLNEVTALVEWPVAVSGKFDQRFLSVPKEALISSMKEHQKYFHLVDEQGVLLPHFITVSNIETDDYTAIIAGNEKVIRPRLADAAFFFETDQKTSLAQRREKLKSVVFQKQLGSIYEKTERIKKLALYIAEQLQADMSLADIERASELCKSDLVSAMVYEFPEMQGIAGYHYALNDGESAVVADAIRAHYQPKFAGDTVPQSSLGAIIALADRIDTISGIFGIGQVPTGSKDPFALRRQSVAVLRILVEHKLPLDLIAMVELAASAFTNLPKSAGLAATVVEYVLERFKAWYEDANIPGEVFLSVSRKNITQPLDLHHRVCAVADFYKTEAALPLAAANKRVANILAKLDKAPDALIDDSLFEKDEERVLANELTKMKADVKALAKQSRYAEALTILANLKSPVDAFFDNVMVMANDHALRENRLSLLHELRELFLNIADISVLAPTKTS